MLYHSFAIQRKSLMCCAGESSLFSENLLATISRLVFILRAAEEPALSDRELQWREEDGRGGQMLDNCKLNILSTTGKKQNPHSVSLFQVFGKSSVFSLDPSYRKLWISHHVKRI